MKEKNIDQKLEKNPASDSKQQSQENKTLPNRGDQLLQLILKSTDIDENSDPITLRGKRDFLKILLEYPDIMLIMMDWNGCMLDRGHPQHNVSLAWRAADLASKGDNSLLDRLIGFPNVVLRYINLNSYPTNPAHPDYGVSLIWKAVHLSDRGRPALLNRFLELPGSVFAGIKWEYGPLNKDHLYYGTPLLWKAAELMCNGKPALLNKWLDLSPGDRGPNLWNYCPLNEQYPLYGASLAWMAMIGANKKNFSLVNRLAEESDEFFSTQLNWNSCPLGPSGSHLLRGMSLTFYATKLMAETEKNPILLNKLLKLSDEALLRINLNYRPLDKRTLYYGVSVVWMAVVLESQNQPALIGRLSGLPDKALIRINWNSQSGHKNFLHYGKSVAWLLASSISDSGDKERVALWARLSELPEVLRRICWNVRPLNPESPGDKSSLTWRVGGLAHYGKPVLFMKMISSAEIMETINWNTPSPGQNSLISMIFFAMMRYNFNLPQEVEYKMMQNLINDRTVLNFFWQEDALRGTFYGVFNKATLNKPANDFFITCFTKPDQIAGLNNAVGFNENFPPCDMALAQLSLETLKTLMPHFAQPGYQTLFDYLGFLIRLKSGSPESPWEDEDYSMAYPHRAATAYLIAARAHTSPACRIHYYKKIPATHPFYFEARFALAHLYLTSSETESMKDKMRLAQALVFALQWARYDKKKTTAAKKIFIKRILEQLYYPLFEILSVSVSKDIDSLLMALIQKLEHCQDLEYHQDDEFLSLPHSSSQIIGIPGEEVILSCLYDLQESIGAHDHYKLGNFYKTGVEALEASFLTKDEDKAAHYFLQAAKKGHPEAQYNLGDCYQYGKGVLKDKKEAFSWYTAAARQGHPDAQFMLSWYKAGGEKVQQDSKEALTLCYLATRRLFHLVVNRGSAQAKSVISNYSTSDYGVRQDELNRTSAALALFLSQLEKQPAAMAYQFEIGIFTKKHHKFSLKLYQLAADQGHLNSQRKMDIVYRKTLGLNLSSSVMKSALLVWNLSKIFLTDRTRSALFEKILLEPELYQFVSQLKENSRRASASISLSRLHLLSCRTDCGQTLTSWLSGAQLPRPG